MDGPDEPVHPGPSIPNTGKCEGVAEYWWSETSIPTLLECSPERIHHDILANVGEVHYHAHVVHLVDSEATLRRLRSYFTITIISASIR